MPLEALTAATLVAQTLDMPIESLLGLLQLLDMPVEALGFVPVPPPTPPDDGGAGSFGWQKPARKRFEDDDELLAALRLLDLL